MPVPRHYVYPVCGVPGNYLQRVYGNEHCSEYYEPCSADDWRDKETGHLYDEQTNRAHCMQMCSDAGWEGCVYTHGGCNDPSKLTFLECQGMWDHDQDGGFAGTWCSLKSHKNITRITYLSRTRILRKTLTRTLEHRYECMSHITRILRIERSLERSDESCNCDSRDQSHH